MFGIKNQFWISSMTIVMLLVIFGSLAEAEEEVPDGKQLHGERCDSVYGQCDYDKGLVCHNEKCQCDPSYGIAKKKPTPPADPDKAGTGEGAEGPKPESIPSKLTWDTEGKTCVTKKSSHCLLDYDKLDSEDKKTFMDCKGKCEKGENGGRDDVGLCKGNGKGKAAGAGHIEVNRILNFGLSCLLILVLLSAK